MIAADTSTWIAFLEGSKGEDTQLLDKALEDRQVLMVPVVLTELLSDPRLPSGVAETLSEVPMIEIEPGYWQRAGVLRAKVMAKGRKARLCDALIAQTCIDRGIFLLTRDRNFRAFADAAGLELVLGIGTDRPHLATPYYRSRVHWGLREAPFTREIVLAAPNPTLLLARQLVMKGFRYFFASAEIPRGAGGPSPAFSAPPCRIGGTC